MTTADEAELNMFRDAVDHVKGGAGKRTYSCSDGWAMVRAGRLVELEIAEEKLGAAVTVLDRAISALKEEHKAYVELEDILHLIGRCPVCTTIAELEEVRSAL